MRDVIVTVVVAIVLALLFMYLLLTLASSGWVDRFPQSSPSAAGGEPRWTVVDAF